VFSSEEYNEYVGQNFNDAFAFFVNGVNCARAANQQPVSVNSINQQLNPQQFRNNELPNATIDTEMDGLTVVLTCQAPVNVGVTNTMKLAIADATDGSFDSNVFIRAGSLTTNLAPTAAAGSDITRECTAPNTGVAVSGSGSSDPDGTIVSYRWLNNGVQLATGVNATLSLAPGVHTIVLEVRDNAQAIATDTLIITVTDTTPPSLSFNIFPTELDQADHTYRAISPAVSATDLCGGSIVYTSRVISNEPDDAPARDGVTTGDIEVTRPGNIVVFSSLAVPEVQFNPFADVLELRAERRTASADRVYTVTVTATDVRGNLRTQQQTVAVPRSNQLALMMMLSWPSGR
jgi:hypothetical protein